MSKQFHHVFIPLILILFLIAAVTNAESQGTSSQNNQSFAPDKMDTILYGVAYYPEYMPYDRLDKDVESMRKAGITVVRVGESCSSPKRCALH